MVAHWSETVLDFWFGELTQEQWFKKDAAVDATITARFMATYQTARAEPVAALAASPKAALAAVIVLDQFPRNMFRGSAKAFSSDRFALAAAKQAIGKNWDMKIDEPARQFFYMPLMHSENLCDQDRCVRLMLNRMPQEGAGNLLHARAHREVIRKFGRFPYRNDALGRHSTQNELSYVDGGGYGFTVEELKKAG